MTTQASVTTATTTTTTQKTVTEAHPLSAGTDEFSAATRMRFATPSEKGCWSEVQPQLR
jgi:hypothetical protein